VGRTTKGLGKPNLQLLLGEMAFDGFRV